MIKRYFLIFNIVLIFAAVYLGSTLFYKIFVPNQDKTSQSSVIKTGPVVSEKKQTRPLSAYNSITSRNLFNTKDKSDSKPKGINLDSLKQTELKVKLWGTVTGPIETAYAVIEETQKKKQNLYKTGDPVQNATLKVILRNKVVLKVNGKDEILELEDAGSNQETGRKSQKTSKSLNRKLSGKKPSTIHKRQQQITLNRSKIEASGSDIIQLIDENLIKPNFNKNGEPDGIVLSNVRSSAILRQMRLRNGDIVSKINGQKINSIEDMIKLFDGIDTSSEVDLQIKRRGKTKNLKYNIQ